MTDTNVANYVDKATSEYLIGTDWGINMQLCDYINNDPGRSKEAVSRVTKKLKEKKSRVQLLALELLETLVKNCEPVHAFVGGKECQAEIIKLIQNKKTKDPVRDRALELVQYWADNFTRRPDLPLYGQTHMLLRKSGVPFPPRRKDETPLVFRNSQPPQTQSRSQSQRQISPRGYGGERETIPKEFIAVRESISLANEMLSFTNPEEDDPNNNDILKDLILTCKESLPNIRAAIESGNFSSEEAMLEMLSLNDSLVSIQDQFDELVKRREYFLKHGTSYSSSTHSQPVTQAHTTTTSSTSNNTNLLDLTSDLQNLRVVAMQGGGLDEFDLLGGARPPVNVATAPPHPQPTAPYNPFMGNSPVVQAPSLYAPVSVAPTTSAPQGAFDEFDMLANRPRTSSASSTTPNQPILTPLAPAPTSLNTRPVIPQQSTSFSYQPQPTTGYSSSSLQPTTGYSAPILTPLKPTTSVLATSPNTQQSYLTPQQQQQQQQQPFPGTSPVAQSLMGTSPVRQTISPVPTTYPNYGYPQYGAGTGMVAPQPQMGGYPPLQPQPMGGKPVAIGVPYGSYTQQMPQYYQQYPQQGAAYPPK